MEIKTIGVIGAGVIGTGVAQSLAQTKHQVILVDIDEEILGRAKEEILKSLRFLNLFNKDHQIEDAHKVLERIKFTTDYNSLEEVDFLIENATENWEVKKQIYLKIDNILPVNCILAANTSCTSITKLAALTKRASNIIGMHFMNPAPVKKMVEVIRGFHTEEETIAKAQQLLNQMGKEGIVVNDMPGFVTNRILMLTINEAIFVVQDQISSPKDVDRLFKTCFGHKMGPLETADLIGLDTILNSIEVLYESFNDSKYRPSPLLKQMVDAGLKGRKSGQGFYSYLNNKKEILTN